MSSRDPQTGVIVPANGGWPVDPQQDMPVSNSRIWIDGCFDFAHHGHAGAMLQARRFGEELYVGVHSDEDILENKGPSVMSLNERVAAVQSCRWVSKVVPYAPYVTSLPWITHYGCLYVVHGDDITSDSAGNDCYRFVKSAGRFLVVQRTPGISTTELVGRMLLCTKSHFIKSFSDYLNGNEGDDDAQVRARNLQVVLRRMRDYASDESGKGPGLNVWIWDAANASCESRECFERRTFKVLVEGKNPKPGQRVIYVDGGFDLFSSGHIEFLKRVLAVERTCARARGWFEKDAINKRIEQCGEDFPPAYIIAGVHDDDVINRCKGLNYPIMNISERGLCLLQCRYVSAVIFSAPLVPCAAYLKALPTSDFTCPVPAAVYHGPTHFLLPSRDPYAAAKRLGLYKEIGSHPYAHVNASEIVQRILKSRGAFEKRQRMKVLKEQGERALLNDEGRRICP